ncbi:amidase signature domain-containing protein [Apodospora peruviana]|uniref:Amidase signature domain-containing protein n=1 Tax=Apodospora peruviana TaxID=516989 RepID=A0AAE0IQ59_9PEZI|nr:amidase signature domain-containing protein [Apodospora peruviana]
MAPSQRFANYPGAKEASAAALEYKPEDNKNPALRGIPLVIASTLLSNSSILQRFFWANAKFGEPKLIPDLSDVPWRLMPDVIPLSDGVSTQSMLPFGPELTQPRPADLPCRFYSVADYHALYKSGELTPLQVTEALLPLIRRDVRPESKYAVAWIQTKPDEVLAAAKASTERWAAGKQLGILDGVPFGVKDDVDVEGFISTRGMRVNKSERFFNTPATKTEWPARKMMEAGAIMMGKMNQHEVGMDTTGCNPATGTPTNWYNTSYYPGGSSSGAGSALSGGIVPITVGTDAGGSMRIPPAFCGVFGLKTTHHRTCALNSSMAIAGPMTATVADLTIAYRTMAVTDESHPTTSMFSVSLPPDPSAKKYIGIHREWINRSDPEVRAVFDAAVAHLTSTGYEVVDIQLPYLVQGQLAHGATCLSEAADEARSRAQDPTRWLHLLNYPNRILIATGSQTPAEDYLKYNQIRQVVMQHLAFLFERYPGLLILTPTTPLAGWPIRQGDAKYGFSDGNLTIRNMTYAWLANTTGCPSVTCPAGYVNPKHGEGKLPVGLMAVAQWGAEEQLLAFARDTEKYLEEVYPGGRLRPAQWADVIQIAREKEDAAGASTGSDAVKGGDLENSVIPAS